MNMENLQIISFLHLSLTTLFVDFISAQLDRIGSGTSLWPGLSVVGRSVIISYKDGKSFTFMLLSEHFFSLDLIGADNTLSVCPSVYSFLRSLWHLDIFNV